MRFALLGLFVLLTACDLAQGVTDERTASEVVTDNVIRAKLNTALLTQETGDLFVDVSSSVFEGRLMLTGAVDDRAGYDQATRIANQIEGVTEVINELQIGEEGGFKATAADVTIETKMKTKLVQDSDVQSVNYRWSSVGGVVYLMGLAQDQAELDRVMTIVRGTSGVKRVVTHVNLKT